MPKKLLDCVSDLKKKGVKNPWGICINSTGLFPHKVKKDLIKFKGRIK